VAWPKGRKRTAENVAQMRATSRRVWSAKRRLVIRPRPGSAKAVAEARREARLSECAVHCPDCNAEVLSERAIQIHKGRGGCIVIPGVRERAAVALLRYLARSA
jgi:hypothetical protein